MSPRGVTARIPAPCLPEEREACPRCRAGVVRLGRVVVCGELSCDWSRPRFDARPAVPAATAPAPVQRRAPAPRDTCRSRAEAERKREADERALLRALEVRGGTIVDLANRARLRRERTRELLCGSLRHRVIRSRIRQSQTAHFALREGTREAVAC